MLQLRRSLALTPWPAAPFPTCRYMAPGHPSTGWGLGQSPSLVEFKAAVARMEGVDAAEMLRFGAAVSWAQHPNASAYWTGAALMFCSAAHVGRFRAMQMARIHLGVLIVCRFC